MISELWQISTSFPTVFFTGLLSLMCLYWVLVIVGAADMDFLDGADGALDGALDGAIDAAAEGALEGALEGAFEAGGEAAGEAIGEAAGESLLESAVEGVEASSSVLSFLGLMGLRKAPLTVVMSFWILFSWMLSAYTMSLLGGLGDSFIIQALTGAGVLLGSLVLTMPLTSLSVRPLAPIFAEDRAYGVSDLVGKSCFLSTGSISDTFGQATLTDARNHTHNLQVRCSKGGNINKGDELLIISVDKEANTFKVVPMTPQALSILENHISRAAPKRGAKKSSPKKASIKE